MSSSSQNINVQEEFSQRLTVHKNLCQDVLVTTEDKVRLCLLKHKERLNMRNEWMVPLGIFLTLIAALCAADFKVFILKAEVWEAIFLLSAVISFVWFVISVIRAWKCRGENDIEVIITTLKAQQLVEDQISKKN